VTIEDIFEIKLVADPNISPDGKRVAFVVTTVDRDKNGYRSAIWMAELDTSEEPYQFTGGRALDANPRWSPDGRFLAFTSNRSETGQIYVIPASGGEPWAVTNGSNAATDAVWAPSSDALYFVAKVDAAEERDSDTKVIDTLKYKFDGEGFWDGKRRQIFVVPRDGGERRQLTDGDWDSVQPAVSPDGSQLAFVSNRTVDRESHSKTDVWVREIASGELRQVTDSDGSYGTPAWSPDGDRLIYTGHPTVAPYGPTTQDDIFVWDVVNDETTRLLSGLDREPGNSIIADARYAVPTQRPIWASDGTSVVSLISDQGSVHIYRCAVAGGREVLAGGTCDIQSFSVARDGSIAFAASTANEPSEVFVIMADGNERRVSATTDDYLADVDMAEVDELRFESDPGVQVHGWLLRPPGFNPASKYPAIVEVHGGPHGMYGTGFFHEMQVLAARGYVVLMTNPRGSTGYGQEWVAGTLSDWGGADYRDVMAGARALAALDYVDESRMGITGGSYGGYMVNWVIGQTDFFKAAVTQRSTVNRMSLYGTSDFNMMYNDWEYGGTPYENAAFYLERSPLSYVQNIKTPTLILHSENDLRCPISQGEELFVALKKHGVETQFVRFPNESHGLSRAGQPKHRIERLQRICAWFDTHL
jgi:dipeptidyl aminopeptidase/acylaminoacyl peptidase